MSYDNILLYYNSNGTSVELLQIIEEKLYNIKRAYEEIKLRIDRKSYLKFEIIDLPEYICFTRRYTGSTTDDRYRNMYNLFHEAVERGYRPLTSEALFVINERTEFILLHNKKQHPNVRILFLSGSSSWARTNDPAVNSRMLCQLSY